MYELARKSLMKFTLETIAALNAATDPAGGMTYDAHGEMDQLLSNDIAGIHQFSIVDNYQFFDVVWGVTISTYDVVSTVASGWLVPTA